MPRADFEMNLTLVQEEIIQLSSMVEKAIYKSVDALKKRDVEASQQVIDEDDLIDLKQQALEERCIELIALESPIAGDLRILISAMMIANELERMGDYAEGIAKISVSMGNLPPLKPLIDIPRMDELAQGMLRDSLDAYIKHDTLLAKDVIKRDDEVDELKDKVFRELLNLMLKDTGITEPSLDLILISRHLERIGDHATNIAEEVIFIESAQDVRHHAQEGGAD